MTQELIERLEPCPYVLGSVSKSDDFSEDDGPLWEAEVQTNGGYGVAATIYADTEDDARQMAEQVIAAWNTRDQSQSARIAELEGELEAARPKYAQPCFDHEYITPGCPDCGKMA